MNTWTVLKGLLKINCQIDVDFLVQKTIKMLLMSGTCLK